MMIKFVFTVEIMVFRFDYVTAFSPYAFAESLTSLTRCQRGQRLRGRTFFAKTKNFMKPLWGPGGVFRSQKSVENHVTLSL